MVQRWRQLPLDRALSYAGRVRALVQSLADAVAAATGVPATPVPDLGPATLMDQLTVMVHDACATASTSPDATTTAVSTGVTSTRATSTAPAFRSALANDLASLRRELV